MKLVLDASTALAWCFQDERTSQVVEINLRVAAEGAIVPPLWRYELANGLLMAERRKRLDRDRRTALIESFEAFDIVQDDASGTQVWSATLALADAHRLTVYDAAYLELALRRSLPLATLDADLRRGAEAAGVEVV